MGEEYARPFGETKSGDNDALRVYGHRHEQEGRHEIAIVGNCWFNSIYFDHFKLRHYWRMVRYGFGFLVSAV